MGSSSRGACARDENCAGQHADHDDHAGNHGGRVANRDDHFLDRACLDECRAGRAEHRDNPYCEGHAADHDGPHSDPGGHGKCLVGRGGGQIDHAGNRDDPCESRVGRCGSRLQARNPIPISQSTAKPEFVVAYRLMSQAFRPLRENPWQS